MCNSPYLGIMLGHVQSSCVPMARHRTMDQSASWATNSFASEAVSSIGSEFAFWLRGS